MELVTKSKRPGMDCTLDVYFEQTEGLPKYINEALTPREKLIIKLRYGLDGKDALTQREVAKMLKISRSYVSRIEKKALSELKKRYDRG